MGIRTFFIKYKKEPTPLKLSFVIHPVFNSLQPDTGIQKFLWALDFPDIFTNFPSFPVDQCRILYETYCWFVKKIAYREFRIYIVFNRFSFPTFDVNSKSLEHNSQIGSSNQCESYHSHFFCVGKISQSILLLLRFIFGPCFSFQSSCSFEVCFV